MFRLNVRVIMLVCSVLYFAGLPAPGLGAGKPARVATPAISSDTIWSGNVVVDTQVTVQKDATLTIKPGSSVGFAKGAGLSVEGVLVAQGNEDAPITFKPDSQDAEPGYWSGINIAGAGKIDSSISRCVITGAQALMVAAGSPTISKCDISGGVMGITLQSRKSTPVIRENRISGMTQGGIQCQMGAAPVITGNTIDGCGPFGIISAQDSIPDIRGNTVMNCGNGISISQNAAAVEDNVLSGNKAGIVTTLASNNLALRRNRLTGNEAGIVCRQSSSPLVEKNVVTGNKKGIICFMSSSPLIRHNTISENDEGISCIQICDPAITANDIHSNGKAIYLDLSSYAVINANNIYDNKVQLELGNMSSDWEYRVRNKPIRGAQAQNLTRAQKGVAVAQSIKDNAVIMGSVDATGNWWGDSVTAEMARKGPDANIESFIDYYDLPTRTYEGYDGEYVQDRIRYEGWKKSRIKDAGI